MPNILYEGPATTDPSRKLVVLAVEHSRNSKTGNQVQVYYLLRDYRPYEVYTTQELRRVNCTGCAIGDIQACYLRWENGPTSVWQSFQSGNRSSFSMQGRSVRLGAAGNPSAAPLSVTREAVRYARNWTGFEHNWSKCDQGFRAYCMASVESEAQRHEAKALGWRTYRVLAPGESLAEGEVLCPASKNKEREAKGQPPITCEFCGICCGTAGTRDNGGRIANVDVAIPVHGLPYKVKRFQTLKSLHLVNI